MTTASRSQNSSRANAPPSPFIRLSDPNAVFQLLADDLHNGIRSRRQFGSLIESNSWYGCVGQVTL